VLDEPTNHLDIPAKQMLEDALMEYEGAALVVSHDRYFIARVANRIVELRDGELVLSRGDYAYYQEKKAEEVSIDNVDAPQKKQRSKKGFVEADDQENNYEA
jgi:ATP-binding cassette subfamily F protein 3